jgi:hypothetical protein
MRHFKILGWLWLVFGLFWSFLAACALLAPSVQPEQIVIKTTSVWWTDLIVNSLEGAFFVASVVIGFGLLRRWRRAHIAIGLLGAFLLAVYLLLVSSPSFPPLTLAQSMLYLSPLAVLALYSIVVVLSVRYEANAA